MNNTKDPSMFDEPSLQLLEVSADMDIPVQEFDPAMPIMVDQWGNEWDGSGDFCDMDFRLVDEDF